MSLLQDIEEQISLRRCILETLYTAFREFPYGLVELNHLVEACTVDPETLNWNIVYLEKHGYVKPDRSMDCPPFISCTVAITARGIDLIENRAEFEKKFPDSSAT